MVKTAWRPLLYRPLGREYYRSITGLTLLRHCSLVHGLCILPRWLMNTQYPATDMNSYNYECGVLLMLVYYYLCDFISDWAHR